MILCTLRDTMHTAGVPIMYTVGLIHILSDFLSLHFGWYFLPSFTYYDIYISTEP